MPPLTVDRFHFAAWCEGVLLDMREGRGFVVNETESEDAEEALNRGETVLLRDGARLTGTAVVLRGGAYQEVKIDE